MYNVAHGMYNVCILFTEYNYVHYTLQDFITLWSQIWMKSKIDITPPWSGQSGRGQPALEGRKSNTGCARRLLFNRGKCSKIVPPIRDSSIDRKCYGRSRVKGRVLGIRSPSTILSCVRKLSHYRQLALRTNCELRPTRAHLIGHVT